ncbi:chemotaxis protein CheW [Wolinella succinogenes]|uniref:chemotaxis protein CheW n=1 Tax=Wolinella succinogenes TaxID=844 RepID=UPI0024091307|nr:chemotaxis protein CheW [Wolinella succinogenes]
MGAMEASRAGVRFLTFFLEGEHYGIEIHRVKEIIAWIKVTKIPKAPAYIRGVMNLRGNIIPVLDLRAKFGLPFREPDMQTSIVVVSISGISIGLVVDRVDEVINTDKEHLVAPPKFNAKIDASAISQMIQGDFGVVAVLSLESIFSQEELEKLDNAPL